MSNIKQLVSAVVTARIAASVLEKEYKKAKAEYDHLISTAKKRRDEAKEILAGHEQELRDAALEECTHSGDTEPYPGVKIKTTSVPNYSTVQVVDWAVSRNLTDLLILDEPKYVKLLRSGALPSAPGRIEQASQVQLSRILSDD